MILGFDIGNTNTRMGLYRKDGVTPFAQRSFKTKKKITADAHRDLIIQNLDAARGNDDDTVEGVVFSSVVPEINHLFHQTSLSAFNVTALEIDCNSRLSISIRYDNPAELGVDRIVNAEGTYREYGGGYIIIDLGTAITFCVLLQDGSFDGGLIAPGIGTTIQALSRRASNLPEISFERPPRLVARNMVNALQSGFFYGWISLVEGVIGKIRGQYREELKVLFTGGASKVISENISVENIHDQSLTMKGIKYIYDMNRT